MTAAAAVPAATAATDLPPMQRGEQEQVWGTASPNSAGLEHRLFPSPPTEPGAVPVTAMRHPAALATAAGLPDPDQGAPATWAP